MPRVRLAPPADGGQLAIRQRTWLEIGFGGGEHLAWQASQNPDVTLIGVEPFKGGVVKLLAQIERQGLENVRILDDDARLLLPALPDASIERCFILFPDPWPKRRHWKRRIVNAGLIADLARLIVPGGELRIATDHPSYRLWILETMLASPSFAWLADGPQDWRHRPSDWPATRYEAKALEQGRRPVFLRFARAGGERGNVPLGLAPLCESAHTNAVAPM